MLSVIDATTDSVISTVTVGNNPVSFGNFISTYTINGIISLDTTPIDVEMYPNPATDNIQIQSSIQINKIEIVDITGRNIYSTTNKTIDCSSFAKGVYFAKVETAKGVIEKKFIKL